MNLAQAIEVVIVGDYMWTVADNGRDLNWFEAKAYCDSCRVGGYDDWQIPSAEMLRKLCSIPIGSELLDWPNTVRNSRKYVATGVWARNREAWREEIFVRAPFRLSTPWQWAAVTQEDADPPVENPGVALHFSNPILEEGPAYRLYERYYDPRVRDNMRVLCVRYCGK